MFRKNLFTFLLLLPVGTIIFIVLFFNYYTPDLNKISQNTRQSSVTIRDINSNVLATYGDIYSGHVKINKISNNLINAVVSIEDHRFYDHYGVDLKGISRAIYVNLIEGEVVQGGSTITQQLSKLLFLNSEKGRLMFFHSFEVSKDIS